MGPYASIHLISTLLPPTCDMRWLIDGNFRGIAAKIGGCVSIAMFRGGRRQNSRGTEPKTQIDTEQQRSEEHTSELQSLHYSYYP